ncbi:MAG: deoxyguanosinetriphosphate triphosphohydrolase [Lachnospiraceae bacterium]|jgi:dGTPase|nr:deoxyguanosinetriphosphate triphosphohydrolase [Lachnospiraceae bacterium]MCI1397230.1 deoxyguanosinetriphosphate triphosphohydrolase [Lachnospiraceae bacterium]MCI1422676.1 deoxyguanosinetriphosphate triphosphohydrolase [Lachnospiraceae bacterium]MCI1451688.1 deoxyguanosinetriphosphate triphosphohydrolase [Lachnospiraceae bacterium]MDD5848635.1 deoxyguanosinetriphosphate triphosphohydrolase [Bacillota bacterium]
MDWQTLLCPDRIRSYHSKGTSDLRSEYEKDYHRIIGSASFRRLQDKTQVFPLDQSDFVRTRLTHSLEVSSFAKSLGQSVGRAILRDAKDPSFHPDNQTDICDILSCAGLLHDIGNPPFGHFGETSIRTFFQEALPRITYVPEWTQGSGPVPLEKLLTDAQKADFLHFEGNAQALRVVTKLHYLVDEHGMNLTKALLATIIKYPVSSLEIDPSGPIRAHKMGYFQADREVFSDVETSCGLDGRRHPLTYLLEAADDIAYHTADIEDAYRKGFLTYHQLRDELEARCGAEDAAEPASGSQSLYRQAIEDLKHRYQKGVDRGMSRPDNYAIQNWLIRVQTELLHAAQESFITHYDEILDGSFGTELLEVTGAGKLNDVLGELANDHVFQSSTIIHIEVAADSILKGLLERFTAAVLDYDTGRELTPYNRRLMTLVSENYRTIYQIYSSGRSPQEKLYLRLMLVTDYVCGMTDSYAQSLYWKLNGRI